MRSAMIPVALLSCLAAVAGCGDEDSATTPAEAPSRITFPLEVGNVWIYDVSGSPVPVVLDDTARVVATQVFRQETYHVLENTSENTFRTGSIWLRQENQDVFIVIPTDDLPNDDEDIALALFSVFLDDFESSFPWRALSFDAEAGEAWVLIEADSTGTFDTPLGELDATLRVSVEAKSRGRVSVETPLARYGDVYFGELIVTTSIDKPGSNDPGVAVVTTERFWVADSVGIVKQESVVDVPGGAVLTTTSELKSVSLK